jgi:hypothetical protein
MRLVLAALLLAPAIASARPITVGASYGMIQSKVDAASDPNSQMTAFGRIGLGRHVEAGLELQNISAGDNQSVIRTVGGLLLVDLATHSHLMPMLIAGLGFDHSSTSYGSTTDAHHYEGGIALEYRADGGIVFGGDLRIGGRSIDTNQAVAYPGVTGVAYRAPTSQLADGEYRSARLYVGVRF